MNRIEGQPILTAAEIRAAEQAVAPNTDALYDLMELAGAGIAAAVCRLAAGADTLILCGPGNNGGDGYVAARLLQQAGHAVRVAAAVPPASELARRARAAWDGPVESLEAAASAPVLVDALFGTGLTRPLDSSIAEILGCLAGRARLSIAVDLPSGVSSDDGAVLSVLPRFDLTLALAALKPAHFLQPAAHYSGAIRLLDIGVPVGSAAHVLAEPTLPHPGPDDHKFSRGMVAVVGGSMTGAAELAARAAAYAGAGYVLLLTEGGGDPQAIVRRPWSGAALADARIGAVVVGPGLGRDEIAWARFDAAWASPLPLLIDGDALRLFDPAQRRAAPIVLTPHEGEFDHLFGSGQGSKIDRARAAAQASDATVVFKGSDTVIAEPSGRVIVTANASPWLSTAGTGDVLAGTCGAMLAAGLHPFAAANAAVWLHGQAARRLGSAFVADDLARALGDART